MKKANGNGSVSKLSGIRRKPYIARVTLGWDESTGRQIRKTIGTYVTQKEAQKALIDYLDNPYDLDLSNILFKDVYEKWSKLKYPKVSHSAILGYQSAYNNVEKLHNMKIKDIKARHLQEAIDSCSKGQATKKKIKFLFGQMFAYAMQNDIITKDYSEFVDIGKASEESKREPFSNKEIELLWKHIDDIEFIDTILIMIYSGFRIGELLELETKNIDLVNMTMTGGLKTEAGKNRLVPIHPKIFPLIEKRYNKDNQYLIINFKGKKMKYDNYYKEKFIPIMEQLNMEHRPHDCRHTFATLLSNANANATAIKKMIGHESYATTEKIYTHKDIEELRKNVELIK
ncbi:site-specific integrase [Fusobacterium mortiferum]|jgi:integrase|uniref:tyrosine-type recombinase/integrase n=1 Tax=Fusobacterium mortiferum TaxID=850 RepID=UPI000E437BEF|nr:site-specific integrase [Fusobacterium mortiferum]MCF2626939.1 site-specific integrase [Fusobacterium mortiferum]RGM99895.1 site-specific integrase [Fusobacterium mortiferum]